MTSHEFDNLIRGFHEQETLRGLTIDRIVLPYDDYIQLAAYVGPEIPVNFYSLDGYNGLRIQIVCGSYGDKIKIECAGGLLVEASNMQARSR